MDAITIWQPYAELIAEELKPFEFRGWRPSPDKIGQRIGVHSGLTVEKADEIEDLIYRLSDPRTAPETGLIQPEKSIPLLERFLSHPKDFARASVICTAILGQPIRNSELANALGFTWQYEGENGNWGFPLTGVQRLKPPMPARGGRMFWPWTP